MLKAGINNIGILEKVFRTNTNRKTAPKRSDEKNTSQQALTHNNMFFFDSKKLPVESATCLFAWAQVQGIRSNGYLQDQETDPRGLSPGLWRDTGLSLEI